ncbi:hypothetical protein JTE90_016624 [Oedothorax gibbosus]|uniref:C2 domain-containing protein n=1 Tax=Oedothorax gibbosus TaxID=931172 RepID=A0AAV6UYQ4_9ARAC|nr:hypothetical protein JTE90_016624 [Oedothorax gibbosus]
MGISALISKALFFISREEDSEILPGLDENVKCMSVEQNFSIVKDNKNIYATLVRVVRNYVGKATYPYLTEDRQLYPYVLFLCGNQEEDPSTQEWVQRKLHNLQLIVVIKEAKVLHLKSEDPCQIMCNIWIDKEKIQKTSSKSTKSDLIWEEVFTLDVPSCDTDEINIEVCSGDNLIGSIVEPIKNLPCIGQEKMCSITEGNKKKQTKGQLAMYIQLSTKKSEEHMFHIQMHMELMKMCYVKQLPFLEENIKWKNWLQILPNPALTLIHQHGLQNGLTPTEQSVCSWILTSTLRINQEYRISFKFLYGLLEGLITDIQEDPIDEHLESALYSSISSFYDYMLVFVKLLHKNFQLHNIEQADELFYMLKCLSCIDAKDVNSYMDSYSALADEGKLWYFSILMQYKEDLKDKKKSVKKSCHIMKKIIKQYLQNQILLDDIFNKAWSVTYSHITLSSLDIVMHDAIRPFIWHLTQVMKESKRDRDVKDSLEMLQLYHCVRELVKLVVKDMPSERDRLAMDRYSAWFSEDLILEWFLLCDMFTKPFIEQAVSLDLMEHLHRDMHHGSSYEDVVSITNQMIYDVWSNLNWEEQFYTHTALIDAIRTCLLDYVTAVSQRVKVEKYFCEKREFVPNTKMLVALSNAYSVFEHLYSTRNKIKGVLRTAETKYGFTIMDPMESIGSHMQIKISKLYLSFLHQIDLKFQKLSTKVLKGRLDILGSHATVVADTCSYVEKTLELLYQNLKREAFYILLRQMWIMIVRCFKDGLTVWKGCTIVVLRKSAYISALQALTQIQQIFYCEGQGLSYFEMECQMVNDLRDMIQRKVGASNRITLNEAQ